MGRAIGLTGKEGYLVTGNVRSVHPGVGAHEAMLGNGNDHVIAPPDYGGRLILNNTPVVGFTGSFGQRPFSFRDHLVSDDEDVTTLWPYSFESRRQHRRQIIARFDFWQTWYWQNRDGQIRPQVVG